MLGVGLVGAGLMGRNHARVASSMPSARLVAVADPDAAAGSHIAERYGAAQHSDPASLLRDAKVDAVVVATPTSSHHAIARAALEAGKHVLVEKPFTSTVDEARELIGLARRKGLVLAVGHVERHNPVVRWARERLASGALGELISIHTRRLSPYPERVRDVGVIMDLGIHDLDVLCYLVGRTPRGVYALAGAQRRETGVEDHAGILADFEEGLTGYVELSWLTPTKVRTLTLTCGEGVVDCDYIEQTASISRGRVGDVDPDNLSQIPVEYTVERIGLRKEEPLMAEHADFYAAIREGRRPLVPGEDGLVALKLANAALTSRREMTRIRIEEE